MSETLNVFLHNKLAGRLYSVEGKLSFIYDDDYLQQQLPSKLSNSLPLQKNPFEHQITSAFFSGLLPDEYIRKRLARYLGVSEKNTFALLKEIGGECAGAISIHLDNNHSDNGKQQTYRVLDNKEANALLSELEQHPMLAGEEDIRMSAAGAQDKLMIALVDGQIAIPTNSTPSTHIIKPKIKDFEETVQNEFFCMKLANTIGLPVPNVYIHWLNNHPYYLIERYDRYKNHEGNIIRLHQEDFCQALHIPPEMKYENEGGPTLIQCFSLLSDRIKIGHMSGKNKITLLQGVIFNFLIGNSDAHGKNFSILYQGEEESLTPFYDLMSTLVYGNAFKAKMAMKINKRSRFKQVAYNDFVSFGTLVGFKKEFVQKQIYNIANKTLEYSQKLSEQLNNDPKTKSTVYEKIIAIISSHHSKLTQKAET